MKKVKNILVLTIAAIASAVLSIPAFASADVASAVESTWNTARSQIESIVNNVVFPVIDVVLAILFFVKLGTAWFDYRKTGHFEFTSPAILFACLVFTLTAPLYLWSII